MSAFLEQSQYEDSRIRSHTVEHTEDSICVVNLLSLEGTCTGATIIGNFTLFSCFDSLLSLRVGRFTRRCCLNLIFLWQDGRDFGTTIKFCLLHQLTLQFLIVFLPEPLHQLSFNFVYPVGDLHLCIQLSGALVGHFLLLSFLLCGWNWMRAFFVNFCQSFHIFAFNSSFVCLVKVLGEPLLESLGVISLQCVFGSYLDYYGRSQSSFPNFLLAV